MNNEALEAIKEAWIAYQNDMRPETRNDFLRCFAWNFEELTRQAPTPEVDLDSVKREIPVFLATTFSVCNEMLLENFIDHLSKRGLLRGDVAGRVMVPIEPSEETLVDIAAACRNFYSDTGPYPRSRAAYKAMIKAARGE